VPRIGPAYRSTWVEKGEAKIGHPSASLAPLRSGRFILNAFFRLPPADFHLNIKGRQHTEPSNERCKYYPRVMGLCLSPVCQG